MNIDEANIMAIGIIIVLIICFISLSRAPMDYYI